MTWLFQILVNINTKNIFDILKELPDEELVLSLNEDENTLNVNCNNIIFENSMIIISDNFSLGIKSPPSAMVFSISARSKIGSITTPLPIRLMHPL